MKIAQILAGYSLGEADLLRRAMGKKKKEEMDFQRARFIKGASEKGVPEEQSGGIFDLVAKFAGYGFNKSHAAAYALISFQTGWLKATHPVEFMAASMSLDLSNTDKLAVFYQDCRRFEVPVKAPDVNRSSADFDVASYELMASGQTVGVFQLESQGMRDTLRKMRCGSIEEITALISVYRPGPMEMIDTYIDRKFGRQEVD